MTIGLPISDLVNVQVNLTPPLAQAPDISDLLILGDSNVIDTTTRIREYSTIAEVATDFGTTAPEYLAALLWFEQLPQPTSLLIGRWAEAATAGQLYCGPLAAQNRVIGPWAAITTGSFTVSADGGDAKNITGLNFSADGNLNAVAATINTALAAATVGVTVAYDAANARFVFTSATTGASSSVSFLTPEGTGTDISGMLVGTNATGNGAYQAPGVAAESALACVQLFNDRFSSQWYAVTFAAAVSDDDHVAVAGYIESSNPSHFYGITTQEGGVVTPGDTENIAYVLQQLGYNSTAVQYSSTNAYAVCSLLARILTTDWSANASTITLMYKQEPGIVPENLSQTEMDALLSCNANVFVSYNNNTAIIQPGICPSSQFIDTVIGVDWLQDQIQTNIYNLLYGSTTKIPQTDAGTNQIVAQITAACEQGVANGLIAPGVWNAGGFGQLQMGQFLPTGYYIYAPPVAAQNEADRQARKSVTIQVAVKLAGAVQTVNVVLNVNQ